jgi:proteic killer suppression protein
MSYTFIDRFWFSDPVLYRIITLDVNIVERYYIAMIKSFRDKETERVFQRLRSRKFSSSLGRMALKKLLLVDAAESIQDLRSPPGNRLERLFGSRKGQYSIRINDQWRVCFQWSQGHAIDVEIVDYH